MRLFAAFAKHAPNKVFFSIVLGGLAGASYALLIPLVLAALAPDPEGLQPVTREGVRVFSLLVSKHRFAAVFLGACVFILTARSISQVVLSRVSMEVTSELRVAMYRRISAAPVAALEKLGSARLIAALTTDVPRIVMGARLLPDLLTNSITLLGTLGYLWYLDEHVFDFVLLAIVFGAVTYQVPMLVGRRYLARSRRHVDHLQEAIRGLIYGAKELKLDVAKREAYYREILLDHERNVLEADKAGHTVLRAAMNYGDLLSFFVIGAVCFVFVNYHAVGGRELVGVIMALLYVTGPLAILLNFVPQVAMAKVSLDKVDELFRLIPEEPAGAPDAGRARWASVLRLEQIVYSYPSAQGEAGFAVGPLDLELRRGEIVFIVGGNGSGKSTLGKLITQHYAPSAGALYFDDERVSPDTLNMVRSGIAAVYSDYYLFDRLLGRSPEGQEQRVAQLLRACAIDHKVSFKDGKFSSLDLSDGQKRRLALVVALLEDKQLYLFDECAADQDPGFKQVFYRQILPALKTEGKAVVVISHDDRYFDAADRLVVMEDGRIQRIEERRSAAPLRAVHA